VHTLWLPPDKDPEFKRARDAHRVMTLKESPAGGKADFGTVGFDSKHENSGQFLIFPKSLKGFDGARVIGVKFDLIEQPKLAAAQKPQRKVSARAKPLRHKTKIPRERSLKLPTSPKPGAQNVVPFEPEETKESASPAHAALIREVRAAMKELQRGKSVAAYQRLERALQK